MENLTLEEYQQEALKTAIYPNQGENAVYPVLGLNGEAGELAEKMKKIIRDHGGELDSKRTELAAELGDVLWYAAVCAYEFGFNLEDIARDNLGKLADRQQRDVLQGSGDNR